MKYILEKIKETKCINIPAVHDRDNASLPLCNFHESRFGHVKMNSGRVAPASIVGVLVPVWRT